MIATAVTQAIRSKPRNTTSVNIMVPSLPGRQKDARPEAKSREPRLGAGGLGVEQGVHR